MNSIHSTSPKETYRPRDRRSGQMLIFVSLSLVFLFAMIGLSVDLGYAYMLKVTAQTAADATAQAAGAYAGKLGNALACGSGGLTCGTAYSCANPPVTPPTNPLQARCLYAQANGFLNTGSQTVSLLANTGTPPNELGNTSPVMWIQATVTQTVNNSFIYQAGFHSGTVSAQAITGIGTVPPIACIYVLSLTASQSLNVTGSSGITGSGCGIYVNSNNSTEAIYDTGSSWVKATNGGKVYMVSGAVADTVTGSSYICSTTGSNCTSSSAATVAPAAVDPFLNLPAPTVPTTCDQTNYSIGNSNTATLNPGTYCGGITAGGAAVLTLNPGMYILNGGGFNSSNGATVNGTGVTFFLTGQHGHTAAGMQLQGNSFNNFSAPSSGTYQGVLFYQDRSITYAAGNAQGNSAHLDSTGTLYFPSTSLSLAGDVTEAKLAIIAYTLTITGSSTYDQDATGTFTGLATKAPSLVQ